MLSIPIKVFFRVILNPIRIVMHQKIPEKQAGFRAGRGCSEQILALSNIIEQCIDWNATLCLNFVDFRKAFDSIHRDTLWGVMRIANERSHGGKQLGISSGRVEYLLDFDYADDLNVLACIIIIIRPAFKAQHWNHHILSLAILAIWSTSSLTLASFVR